MIVLENDTYVVGIWFLQGRTGDFLSAITRTNQGPLTLQYRFRWYQGPGLTPSDLDPESWYTASSRTPAATDASAEDDFIAGQERALANLVREGYAVCEPWRCIIRGDSEAALRAIATSPFSALIRVDVGVMN